MSGARESQPAARSIGMMLPMAPLRCFHPSSSFQPEVRLGPRPLCLSSDVRACTPEAEPSLQLAPGDGSLG
eukprot:5429024-Pyramimonas_sp.AAC.1